MKRRAVQAFSGMAVMAAIVLLPLKAQALWPILIPLAGILLPAVSETVDDSDSMHGCEVDVEDDGASWGFSGDADDICAAWTGEASGDGCRLADVVERAMSHQQCAIDEEDGKYGAVIVLRAPAAAASDAEKGGAEEAPEPPDAPRIAIGEPLVVADRPTGDGSSHYGKWSGDPLIIAGYALRYTRECLGKSCNPGHDGDWEKHLLDDAMDRDHDAFGGGNSEEHQVTFAIPAADDRPVLVVDVGAGEAAFRLGGNAYLQLRYVDIELKSGAAIELREGGHFSAKGVRIDVGADDGITALFLRRLYRPFAAPSVVKTFRDAPVGGHDQMRVHIDGHAGVEAPMAVVWLEQDAPRYNDEWLVLQAQHTMGELQRSVAFDEAPLPRGVSLVGWEGAEGISCRVSAFDREAGTWRCTLSDPLLQGVHRLVAGDEWEEGKVRYEIGALEPIDGGEVIIEAPSETLFTLRGQRIAIEWPRCPGTDSRAGTDLACSIEHGAFLGFAADGGWDFTCDEGFQREGEGCVVDCREHTHPSPEGTECLLDEGYEWNGDHSAVGVECPGEAVPDAAVTGACACDGGRDAVFDGGAGGWRCLAACPGPSRHGTGERDVEGRCLCEEGYELRGNRCREIRTADAVSGTAEPSRPAALPRSAKKANQDDASGEPDPLDPPDISAGCAGPFCAGSAEADASGSGSEAGADDVARQRPAAGGGGCSLTAAAGDAGWIALSLALLPGCSARGSRRRARRCLGSPGLRPSSPSPHRRAS